MRYIFVVGLPRTGTKLLQSVLHSCSGVHCRISPEIWFFGDLFRSGIKDTIRSIGNMEKDANVRELVEYLYSGKFNRTYTKLLNNGKLQIEKSSLLTRLLESDRSDKGIYVALMEAVADVSNENNVEDIIVGDKTPANLYHVEILLGWFPDAKVIHTFRDPRAIMASELKRLIDERPKNLWVRMARPFYPLTIVGYITFSWLYAVVLDRRYSKRYPRNYMLSKYENLVTDQETHILNLCKYLEVDFDSAMLAPAKKGSSFGPRGGSGFDTDAIHRWRQHLKPWIRVWLSLVCGKHLKQFGYD